jgi:hypothetical protein
MTRPGELWPMSALTLGGGGRRQPAHVHLVAAQLGIERLHLVG